VKTENKPLNVLDFGLSGKNTTGISRSVWYGATVKRSPILEFAGNKTVMKNQKLVANRTLMVSIYTN
jgi:hypothetical protein